MNPLANTISELASALERVGIPYAIGGSVASSVRGIVRATIDVDVVVRIGVGQTEALAAALGPDWYADADQMRASIVAGRAFNVIYLPFVQKVDVFPATEEFHRSQLERATKVAIPFLGDSAEYPVASAEDILLAKLQWYRMGGEVSERQWTDIAGILAVAPNLDATYLRTWAARLGVGDLLDKAAAELKRDQPW
jgi:hypothetical protein